MINRYPRTPGCRLDANQDGTGPALDLTGVVRTSKPVAERLEASLWTRDQQGNVAHLKQLNAADLQALRDGINQMLVEAGAETVHTVTIPANSFVSLPR